MLGGAAITAVLGLFLVIATIADKNVLTDSTGKRLTARNSPAASSIEIVVYLVLATVWVLMARMNRAGREWARWIASALAAISTLDTFRTVDSLKGGQTLTVIDIVVIAGTVITWVIGVLAVAMLWRSESSEYFRARGAAR